MKAVILTEEEANFIRNVLDCDWEDTEQRLKAIELLEKP